MFSLSVVCGAINGKLDAVTAATTEAAGSAVTLALGLVGVMTLWLGLMRILNDGGLLRLLARRLQPLMVRLFPEVPVDHPAMSMMILNITSNMLGLANAATPFGLKAMMELEKLNKHKGVASDAMILFLAINTSGLAVFPTGIIAIRAALGSQAPGAIFGTTLIATTCATVVAVCATKLIASLRPYVGEGLRRDAAFDADDSLPEVKEPPPLVPPTGWRRAANWLLVLSLVGAFIYAAVDVARHSPAGPVAALKGAVNGWMLLFLIAAIVLFGACRGVKVYDAIVEGGKEGFGVARRIIPYMVAMLVAVGMLRASGAIDLTVRLLDPLTSLVGMPAEALPMALLRPLSGSGALAVAADTMRTYGPDSLVGQIVSTLNGSSETTFFVMALYFGVVQVGATRWAIVPCMLADLAGALTAVWACRLLLN
ncbi:MAG: spore maturation protein [Acetobacteraceae bacterium]|nr:MAG: spore maturation protein [Acetobacteraceae bacterium]